MGDIFRSAQRVVAWLGLASEDSPLALRLLGDMGERVQVCKHSRIVHSPDSPLPDWRMAYNAAQIDNNPKAWDAVFDLLCRPWFSRVWVS